MTYSLIRLAPNAYDLLLGKQSPPKSSAVASRIRDASTATSTARIGASATIGHQPQKMG
jgi:hypothetical protein